MPPITLSTRRQYSGSEPIAVTAEGTAVMLEIPPAQELESATLLLAAEPGETVLGTSPTDITLSGPDGAFPWSERDRDWIWPNASVSWISVEWGQRRALTFIHIKSTSNAPARIKISEGGGWFPPTPIDVITFNAPNRLPAAMASRLMVEVMRADANSVLLPATAQITGVTMQVAKQPQGLSVSVGEEAPFFELRGQQLPGQAISVPGVVEAVNAALSAAGGGSRIPLLLRAEVPGALRIVSFTAHTVTVKRALEGQGPKATLPLPWAKPAIGRLEIGSGSTLRDLSFTLQAELAAERLFLAPDTLTTATAHFCDPSHAAAQGFAPMPADLPLAGVDIYLRPLTREASGTLALHPDRLGRPHDAPFPGTAMPVSIKTAGPRGAADWVACSLPKPLRLGEGPWWAVLTMDTGELLWHCAGSPPPQVPATIYRVGGAAWLPRGTLDTAGQTWALARLRVPTPETPLPRVRLTRGEASLEVDLPADGRVVLAEPDLAPLNSVPAAAPQEQPAVELVVTAESAGEAVISELRVRYREET